MTNSICLIEDDTILADMYQLKFGKAGFGVTVYFNATNALAWLENNDVDIILLDILLPGMTGFQFIKALRMQKRHLKTPIVILTNLTQADSQMNEQLRHSLGVVAYFVKAQITPSKLVSQVSALLK